ncbi:hypothetical protein [Emticicia fontis]
MFFALPEEDKTDSSKEKIKSDPTYKYTDAIGKRLLIQNGFPKGEKYTDPNGKEYFKIIFWTRISNETDTPLELKINFPEDSYEVPALPGKYYKILVPPDTMTVDKEPLFNYGLTDLNFFLDNNLSKPSSLKRTIHPKESSGFYVVILRPTSEGANGTLRTGLSLKGQDLFYRIKLLEPKSFRVIYDKEILCGSISLKKLKLQK